MFDIDSGKLLIVAVLALIVIGPKELPRVLRQVGQAVGKMRRMAGEFQGQFMDAMKEADIADIRKELDDLNKTAALDVHFNPARDIQNEFTSVMAPLGSTVSETSVASPAQGFDLPKLSEAEPDSVAAGLAPVAEPDLPPSLEAEPAAYVNGATQELLLPAPKRKIFVKRRSSSFAIVRPDAEALATGEPMAIKRRMVRVKANETDGVQRS